ncbi:MAG: D-alanyl-D-alanine carboxypeptidase [Candidatus Peribacteraceae bacterium]|nr:D-alanyl-D-alanine carboxypeptidase [Candidatus Peribacteraceae bacterium]
MGMIPAASPLPYSASSLSIPISPPAMEQLEISKHLSASGVIVMDMESGQSIYKKQAEVRRPMASLTKLMTAIIISEQHDMDEIVVIPNWANSIEGNRIYLPEGDRMRVGDLLSGLLIASGNDVANILAVYHSGSVDFFVEEMNSRAQTLGLKSTSFANPSGLDDPVQWSTPQDMAWLVMYALGKQEISSRMKRRSQTVWTIEGKPISLVHTHVMMHGDNAIIAGKTGTTIGAGQCLISVVEEESKSYLVVMLHSLDRYGDMKEILNIILPDKTVVADVS